MKSILIFIPAVFLMSCSFGQEFMTLESAPSKAVKQYEAAIQYRADRDLEKALDRLEKVLSDQPDFIDAHMLRSEILFGMQDLPGAVDALNTAVALDSFYEVRNWYSLSRLYELQGKYVDAQAALDTYLKHTTLHPDRSDVLYHKLREYGVRDSLLRNPVSFDPQPLPGDVNTSADEALPAVAIDAETMLFTRRERGDEDIYIASWDSVGLQWSMISAMEGINSGYNEGAHSISADGRVLAFTACNRREGMGSCDIFLSIRRADGRWGPPVPAKGLNSAAWDGQPALTADGYGMYFSSDRPGGNGKRDLYYSRIGRGGIWSEPENLGPEINTKYNESSPFLHYDDRTMYFMSDGHFGMGDYDLFLTRKTDTSWSKPENLGYPINTPGREGALTVHPDGTIAYYTREDPELRTMDIFTFDLPPEIQPSRVSYLRGEVVDATNDAPVIARISLYPLLEPDDRTQFRSDSKGEFSASLSHGRQYGMHVVAEGYIFHSEQFDMGESAPYSSLNLRIELQRVVRDTMSTDAVPVVLRNVEFESGSSVLTSESTEELHLLLSLLQAQPSVDIEIRGHTDNVGDPKANLVLSTDRAKAVYEWLVNAGIDPDRLTYRGFGEERPIAENNTESGRQRNRRTEFVVNAN